MPMDMIATRDGGFLVVGATNNALTTGNDILAIKFDSGANIEWVGIYSGGSEEFANGVVESANGGYLVTGVSSSYGDNSKTSVLFMKISPTGQRIWSKLIGGVSAGSMGRRTKQSKDGAIYIGGNTEAFGIPNNQDILVAKFNSNGDLQWVKLLGGLGESTLWSLIT